MTAPPPPIDSLTDRDLVARYVRRRDELAFAALVRRHSSLVLGVCQRVLAHSHDVEDAFQATFLVLARDAQRVRKRDSLASWLHGVAYRTSLRAAESRHRRIRLLQDVTMIEDTSLADVEHRHRRQLLDEEVQSLPEKYRAPLVLHYLESKTAQQVADDLKLSVSTVEGRLKRGRKELRLRLARRGIGLSVALAALHLTPSVVTAAQVETLVGSTIHAGLSYTAGDPAGPLFTHEAAHLAAQETIAMTLTTTTATLTAALLVPLALSVADHGTTHPSPRSDQSAVVATTVSGELAAAPLLMAQADASGETTSADPFDPKDSTAADDSPAGVLFELKGTQLRANAVTFNAGELALDLRRAPGQWHFKDQPASVQRIEAALESPTQLEFVDTPLADALEYVAQQNQITILIDDIALSDVGVPTDEPINLIISDVKLESALNLILRNLGLDYIIRDEVLTITTEEVAEGNVDTRVYDIRQLSQISPPELAELIQQTASAPMHCTPIDGAIVVTHNQRGHRQIVDLLEQLLRHAEAGADDTARQHSSAAPARTPQEVPWRDREKTTVMYDIRNLVERYDGIGAASDEIYQRAKPLGVKWGGGIMADHLIAVTTPEQHRVLRKIIDRMLDEEAE